MSTNLTVFSVGTSVTITESVTLTTAPTRLRGIDWMNAGANVSTIEIHDLTSTVPHETLYEASLPAGGTSNVYFTDMGIRFPHGIAISIGVSSAATIYVG